MVEYVCIYRQNLALNDPQRLICHKSHTTKPNQLIYSNNGALHPPLPLKKKFANYCSSEMRYYLVCHKDTSACHSVKLELAAALRDELDNLAQSAGAVEYTDCIYAEGIGPPPTTVLHMTLNNLTMRLQSWSFGEWGWYSFIAIAPRSTLARSGSSL